MNALLRRCVRGAMALCLVGGTAVVLSSSSVPASAAAMPEGAVFVPTDPQRLFDSRDGSGLGGAGAIPADSTTVVEVTGSFVPVGAVGVVMNLTYVDSESGGFITVYPADISRPGTSNLNKVGPGPVANNVTVRLSATGEIAVYNHGGATDLIADVAGYYLPGAGAPGPQGEQGVQGDTGVQGIQGDAGVQGDTGIQGLQGVQGVQGDTNEQGIQEILARLEVLERRDKLWETSYHLPGSGGAAIGSYLSLLTGNGHAELSLTCNYGFVGDTEAFWFANDLTVGAGSIEITNMVDGYPMQSFDDLEYNAGGQDRAFPPDGQATRPWHGAFTANEGGILTRWDVTITDAPDGGCTAVVYAPGAPTGTVIFPHN